MRLIWLIPLIIVIFLLGVFLAEPLMNGINAVSNSEVFQTRKSLRNELVTVKESRDAIRARLEDEQEGLTRLASELQDRDFSRLTREALLGAAGEEGENRVMLRPAESEMLMRPADRDSAALGAVRSQFNRKVADMLDVSRRILGDKVARLNLELKEINTDLQERNLLLKEKLDELDEYRKRLDEQKAYIGELEGIRTDLKEAVTDLETKIEDGQLKVSFQGDILFASGSHKLRAPGRRLLDSVFPVLLQQVDKVDIFVAGHTDNVPIRPDSRDRYASNWELSTYRAIEVVKYLTDKGMNPRHLTAAGYGEYKPVAENSTEAGRSRNRRVELFLIPQVIRRAANALKGDGS